MAEIVNLRTKRKEAARKAARAQADANAALFGRTKAQKAREQAEAARAAQLMDGHLRTPNEDQDRE